MIKLEVVNTTRHSLIMALGVPMKRMLEITPILFNTIDNVNDENRKDPIAFIEALNAAELTPNEFATLVYMAGVSTARKILAKHGLDPIQLDIRPTTFKIFIERDLNGS